MYNESEKWAFPFQTYVTLTMLQTHTAETTKRIKLMERSLYSARWGAFCVFVVGRDLVGEVLCIDWNPFVL